MVRGGGVLLALAVALAVLVATDTRGLEGSDRPINTALRWPAEQWDGLAEFLRVLAEIGFPAVATVIAVAFGLFLLAQRRRGWVLYFATVALGGVIITEVTKRLVGRPRPQWPDPLAVETSYSFPSGHTTSGITMWATMGIVVLLAFDRTRWRTVLGWGLVVVGIAMGVSRLLLGVHWVSDVLGGWLFGLGWLLLVSGLSLGVVRSRQQSEPGRSAPEPP